MSRRTARPAPRDRGAAAVEFALLLPMLLLLIFGIIDFGRALNAQITLTQAAREGARVDSFLNATSLGNASVTTTVTNATKAAATGLSGVTVTPSTTCAANAGPTANATVQVSYTFTFITPINAIASMFGSTFGSSMTLTATGVMPCET